ncbi:hypothetical protein [Gemmatimonas sp.]|uniref:hypothetical protein n=1 Tax=Gemmatimonas sp. TaxID=1962908 RepID=UPI00391BE903
MNRFRSSLLVTAIASAAFVAACGDERSITTEPVGALGFGTNFLRTATNLPRGTVTFPATIVASATPANDSVIITLAGLDTLTGGSYTVWFANDSATKFAPATALNIIATRRDSSFNAAGDPVFTNTPFTSTGAQFRSGGANVALRVATSRAAAAAFAGTDSLNTVLISIESGAPGTAPSAVRPLWARRSQANASRVSGIRFGTFARGIPVPALAGNPAANQEYVFANNGAMTIVPRGRVEVRGGILVVNDSNYFRPPVGYYYNLYGVKLDTTGRFNDTLYLGRRQSPYPQRISLYDADVSNPAPSVVFDAPRVILAMGARLSADSLPKAQGTTPWRNFGFVRINLEPKAGREGRMGSATLLEATLPPSIRGR